jgi:cell division protein FtsN
MLNDQENIQDSQEDVMKATAPLGVELGEGVVVNSDSSEVNDSARKILQYGVVSVAIGTFTLLAWYAYQWTGAGHKDIESLPLVRAETEAFKHLPEDPGGIDIPHQDKQVYDVLSVPSSHHKTAESLVPSYEKPVVRELTNQVEKEGNTPAAISKSSSAKKVRKTANVSDITAKVVQAKPTKQVNKAVTKPKSSSLRPITGYKVQLGSYKSQKAAEIGWTSIFSSFKSDLGTLGHDVIKKKLGQQGTFFRLHVGPFRSETDARAFCQKLKLQKQGCFFVSG